MSELILVRHGQASFLGDHYDRLSERGEEQAWCLGRYWVERGLKVDAVFVGPRSRHAGSAEATGQELQAAGLAWPTPIELPGLDEHGAVDALADAKDQLALRFPELAALGLAFKTEQDPVARTRAYGRMFDTAMRLWVDGSLDDVPGMEPWSTFQQRVQGAIQQLTADSTGGRTVVAFTSGGPCAVAVQHALGCDDHTTVTLASRVRNTALIRFAFSAGRFSLDVFNATPHLRDPELETFL